MGRSPFHGGRQGGSAIGEWFEASAEHGGLGIARKLPGEAQPQRQRIAAGELVIIDPLSRERGFHQWKPVFDDRYLVPADRPLPTPPGASYQEAIRLHIYVRGRLLPWLVTSQYIMRAMYGFLLVYESYTEAELGLIPVCEYSGDEARPSNYAPGEFFQVPVFKIVAWDERDISIFGYPTVRPPLVRLAETAPPVTLPAPAPRPSAPPPPGANDEAEPYRPIPVVQPAPAPTPPAAPANDLLAKYRRRT
jgi:hypothetical protein